MSEICTLTDIDVCVEKYNEQYIINIVRNENKITCEKCTITQTPTGEEFNSNNEVGFLKASDNTIPSTRFDFSTIHQMNRTTTSADNATINNSQPLFNTYLPNIFGVSPVAGNLIWAGMPELKFFVDPTSKKIVYYFIIDLAFALAEKGLKSVTRAWMDGSLIFNYGLNTNAQHIVEAIGGYIFTANVNTLDTDSPLQALPESKKTPKLTFFDGGTTQLPAEIIIDEETIQASPAYRNVSYVTIENLILTSPNIPSFVFEVTSSVDSSYPHITGILPSPIKLFDRWITNNVLIDLVHKYLYVPAYNFSSGDEGFSIFDFNTLDFIKDLDITNTITESISITLSPGYNFTSSGNILLLNKQGNYGILHIVDPFSSLEVFKLGPGGGSSGHSMTTGFGSLDSFSFMWEKPYNLDNIKMFTGLGYINKSIGFATVSDINVEMKAVFNNFTTKSNSCGYFWENISGATNFVDNSVVNDAYNIIFCWGNSEDTAFEMYFFDVTDIENILQKNTTPVIIPFDILGLSGKSCSILECIRDPLDSNVILFLSESSGMDCIVKYDPIQEKAIWKTRLDSTNVFNSKRKLSFFITDRNLDFISKLKYRYVINLDDGTFTKSSSKLTSLPVPSMDGYENYFFGPERALIYRSKSPDYKIIKLFGGNSVTAQITVEDALIDAFTKLKIDSTQYDTSALSTSLFNGLGMSNSFTIQTLLDVFSKIFFTDTFESDGKITFNSRNNTTSEITVPFSDLGLLGEQTYINYTTPQTTHKPSQIALTYPDLGLDYAQNVQIVSAPTSYDPINTIEFIDTPVTMTSINAMNVAETLLYAKSNFEQIVTFILPLKYSYLNVADIVTLQLEDGSFTNIRILTINWDKIGGLNISGYVEDEAEYDTNSFNDVATTQYVPPVFYKHEAAILPLLMEIPYIYPEDVLNNLKNEHRIYVTLAQRTHKPINTTTKKLPTLLTFSDNQYSNKLFNDLEFPPTFGIVSSPLLPRTGYYSTDYDSQLTVNMLSLNGLTLTSAPDKITLLNTPEMNLAYIEKELIQYETVTNVSGNIYKFTGLHRAKNGTEMHVNTHKKGEIFIPLHSINTSENTKVRTKFISGIMNPFVTQATILDNNPNQYKRKYNYRPKNLQPLPITNIKIEYVGENISITWARREIKHTGITILDIISDIAVDTVTYDSLTPEYVLFWGKEDSSFNYDHILTIDSILSTSYTIDLTTQTANGFINTVDTAIILIARISNLNTFDLSDAKSVSLKAKI